MLGARVSKIVRVVERARKWGQCIIDRNHRDSRKAMISAIRSALAGHALQE